MCIRDSSIADELFSWNLFSEKIEKIAILLMSSTGIIIMATFLLSLMVNFSLISISLEKIAEKFNSCLLYTSPSPRDRTRSRMPSSA